jgi:hypothetical protein
VCYTLYPSIFNTRASPTLQLPLHLFLVNFIITPWTGWNGVITTHAKLQLFVDKDAKMWYGEAHRCLIWVELAWWIGESWPTLRSGPKTPPGHPNLVQARDFCAMASKEMWPIAKSSETWRPSTAWAFYAIAHKDMKPIIRNIIQLLYCRIVKKMENIIEGVMTRPMEGHSFIITLPLRSCICHIVTAF